MLTSVGEGRAFFRPRATGSTALPSHDCQVPAEPCQPHRVRRQGALHGGRQPFHTQEQGEDDCLPRSSFSKFYMSWVFKTVLNERGKICNSKSPLVFSKDLSAQFE